jgi:hypothetical protein
MYAKPALAALAVGFALHASAQEQSAETVTVIGQREVPMIARCARKAITLMPEAKDSAMGKLGLAACINEGTLESLFNTPRERVNHLNQLLFAYQRLTQLRDLGTPLQDGEGLQGLPNFTPTRLPDGTYSFIWEITGTKNNPAPQILTGLLSLRPAL